MPLDLDHPTDFSATDFSPSISLITHESRNSPSLTQLEKRCATGVEDMRELAERKNPCSFGDGDAEIG